MTFQILPVGGIKEKIIAVSGEFCVFVVCVAVD